MNQLNRRLFTAMALAAFGCGTAMAAEYGDGVLVGQVVKKTTKLSRKLVVDVNGQEWTLHMAGSTRVFHARERYSVHDVSKGSWVKADGRRIGERRLDVDTLYVIGDRAAYENSRVYHQRTAGGFFKPLAPLGGR